MNDHERALQVLLNLPLRCIGRAADLLWLHFGEWREVPNLRGGTRQVGEWALHVQTSWNFARGTRIVVGVRDLYYYSDNVSERYDWDKGGVSCFDRHAQGAE